MNRYAAAILFLFLCSCDRDVAEVYYEDERFYHDIPAYMNKQIDRLQEKDQWVRKHVMKDGHSQIIERGNINWKDELSAFVESDINRPAWRGEFKIDTIRLERQWVITYKTTNPQIPVKNVVVTIDRETSECLKVTIDRSSDNFLYSSEQKLFFTLGEGYAMKGRLSVNYLFESEYAIDSEFINR